MSGEQLFVGGVSILLGILGLVAAIHNHDWYYQLPKTRWVEARWGRVAARLAYATLGIALVVLGVVIVLGLV
jgi:hypothetical protein